MSVRRNVRATKCPCDEMSATKCPRRNVRATKCPFTILVLFDIFHGVNCPTLSGKPKLLIIDYSRGYMGDSHFSKWRMFISSKFPQSLKMSLT